MKLGKKKKKKTIISGKISPGIVVYERKQPEKESVYYLTVKGIMIFLLVFGNIGGFLSAFQMEYHQWAFAVTVLLGAIFFSVIYYSNKVRDISYILFFAVFIYVVVKYRYYINSGFYAIVNEMILTATDYLDVKGANEYSEFFSNRYLTVTLLACFLGLIDAMLMNITMLTRIRRFTSVLISITVLVIPLYFNQEPELLFVCCTMAGLGSMLLFKAGGHYQSIIQNPKEKKSRFFKSKNKKAEKQKIQRLLSYKYSWKIGIQSIVSCLAISVVTIVLTQMFIPKEEFSAGENRNEWKTAVDDKLRAMWKYGIDALFEENIASGGIGRGNLASNATVRPDYETDLILTFTPYSTKTIYLKAYTGVRYGDNRWREMTPPEGVGTEDFLQSKFQGESLALEAGILATDFKLDKSSHVARGIMKIENVGADEAFLYYPYYRQLNENGHETDAQGLALGQENTYVYYPLFEERILEKTETAIDDVYLQVPEENYQVVSEFCKEINPSGSQLEQVKAVVEYFRENIPYTVRPGTLPEGQDAINYFLSKNRKGYCTHFASAATLIFRHLGIPARYVEGYAVGYEAVMRGEILQESYGEYYEGYSELGETGVVKVQVSDALAHAWVEIYQEGFGWIPVEVTVSASIDEENYGGFAAWLGSLFSTENNAVLAEGTTEIENAPFVDIKIERVTFLLGILVPIIILWMGVIVFRKLRFRCGKDESEKVIGEYCLLCGILRYLEPDFCKCTTHQEQWAWITHKIQVEKTLEELPKWLESISYGQAEYSMEHLQKLNIQIRNLQKQVIKQGTLKAKVKIIRYFLTATI